MKKIDVFPYGSAVYGTATVNSDSDTMIVTNDYSESEVRDLFLEYDVTLYSSARFQELLDAHEISVLESYFLPRVHPLEHQFYFGLDLTKLRAACAGKASNSWVKAKKKLDESSPDYAPYIGKKSAWHAIRILDFACQIAQHGGIVNYASCNGLYTGIMSCDSWAELDVNYRLVYNQKRSLLRLLAPKEV